MPPPSGYVRASQEAMVVHHAWHPWMTVLEATSGGSGGGGHHFYGTPGGGTDGELLREVVQEGHGGEVLQGWGWGKSTHTR